MTLKTFRPFEPILKFKFEIILFFLILVGLLLNPYYFAISDHAYKIPFLKATYQPELYARDLTIGMRQHYESYFDLMLWPLVRVAGIEIAFFFIFYITKILFYISIYLLGTIIFKEKIIGLLSVVLLWFPHKVLGAIDTFDSIVQQRSLAAALLLLGVYFSLSKKRLWAGVFFAFAANIHIITFVNFSLFGAVALSVYFLSNPNKIRTLKEFLPAFLLLLIGLLPIILKSILSAPLHSRLVFVDPVWLQAILMRSGFHLHASWEELFILLIQAAGGLAFLFWRVGKKNNHTCLVLYFAASASLILGWLLNIFFIEHYPLLIGIQLMFLRASYLFVVLTPIVWAYLFFEIIREQKGFVRGLGIAIFAITAILIPIFKNYPKAHIDAPWKFKEKANVKAQLWLKQNTDLQAMILTPPWPNVDFRIYSERSLLGTWKDWTYNILDREFAFTMYERLRDVAGISLGRPNFSKMRRYYDRLSDADFVRLAGKYKFDYVVVEDKRERALEKVYENKKYTIYRPIFKVQKHLQQAVQ